MPRQRLNDVYFMSDLILIQRKIFEIRGQRVMLDRDLAALYQVETKRLNQQVQRNIERFPDDFMFQLTKEEFESLRSQIATSNDSLRSQSVTIDTDSDGLKSQFATSNGRGGLRYLPYAFTEHGVVMLASLLRSDIAVTMSVQITRAFVAMRQTIAALATTATKVELLNEKVERLNMYIEEVLHDQNDINEDVSMQLELINQSLAELQAKPKDTPRRRIGFNVDDDN